MKKVLLVLLLFIVVSIIAVLYQINILPIIEDGNVYMQSASESIHQKGDLINPLEGIAQCPELEIYVYIHRDDISELPSGFPRCKVLYTNDVCLIRRVIDNFSFIYTGSDMATCESVLYVKSKGKIIYKTNIVINDCVIGLQDTSNGWLESCNPANLIDVIKIFESIYSPFVVI